MMITKDIIERYTKGRKTWEKQEKEKKKVQQEKKKQKKKKDDELRKSLLDETNQENIDQTAELA